MTMTFTYSAVTYTLRPVMGAFSGYGYEDELSVQKLLGKNPARPDKNEVLQSSGLGARSATMELYATAAERDQIEALLWKQVVHDDGLGNTPRLVVITKCQVSLYHKAGATAAVYKLLVSTREFGASLIVPTGLLAWYKADDLIDTYADGANITSWPDASGNGNTMIQDGGSGVPIFKRAIVSGGLPVARIVSGTKYLRRAPRIGDSLGTVCAVAGGLTNGSDAPALAASPSQRIVTYYSQNDNLYPGDSGDVMRGGSGVLDRWSDRNFIQGSGNTDDNLVDTKFHVISEAPPAGGAPKVLDGAYTLLMHGNQPFKGDLAEILFFSTRLSTSDRIYVETYLKNKYGL